jgi:hypothetical protein
MSNTNQNTIEEAPEAHPGPEWGSPEELSEFAQDTTPEEPLDEPGPCDLAR